MTIAPAFQRPLPWRRALAALVAACCLAPTLATGQDYPNKPIRLIVPFAAGGPTDVVARMLAEKMGAVLKQSLVVDNRGGAGGALGTDALAKARADGYTIGLATASTHEFAPACSKDSPYHPVNDFSMVGIIATAPSMLYVRKDAEYAGLKDVVSASLAKPGQITWGTPGPCSNTHFLIALVNKAAGARITPVPYRGNSAASTDLISGVLTLASDAITPASIGLIKSGSVRPIALTAKTDVPELHGVPTYADLGVDIGSFTIWQGLVAPAKTPPEVLARLNTALKQALADPDLRQRWAQAGIQPYPDNRPETMRRLVLERFQASRQLAAELGIQAN
jgi:tripartite-type tricarboxylate transporter receptor subunit TctC